MAAWFDMHLVDTNPTSFHSHCPNTYFCTNNFRSSCSLLQLKGLPDMLNMLLLASYPNTSCIQISLQVGNSSLPSDTNRSSTLKSCRPCSHTTCHTYLHTMIGCLATSLSALELALDLVSLTDRSIRSMRTTHCSSPASLPNRLNMLCRTTNVLLQHTLLCH